MVLPKLRTNGIIIVDNVLWSGKVVDIEKLKNDKLTRIMHNFNEINSVYATYFNEETAPARETVEVANLPKFVNVEVSMIAVK